MTTAANTNSIELLFSSERTSLALLSGLDRWRPPGDATPVPVESPPEPVELPLLPLLQAAVQERLSRRAPVSEALQQHPALLRHWRDIYHQHQNKTSVIVGTPDPRLHPNFSVEQQADDHRLWPQRTWLRFMRARALKVDRASVMITDYLHWYQAFGVKDLIAQPVCPFGDLVAQFYPEKLHGVDRAGQPIIIGTAGLIDLDAYHTLAPPLEAAFLTQTYKQELLMRAAIDASYLSGKRQNMWMTIQDLDHFTLAHRAGVPWVKNCSLIMANFYPETLYTSVVPNVPVFFTIIWAILKTFLDERTQRKVSFPGSDWKKLLLDSISPENVPKEWGGSCTRCKDGCLPIHLPFNKAAIKAEKEKQMSAIESAHASISMTSVVVAARAVHEVEHKLADLKLQLQSDGTSLYTLALWWRIELESKDIDFSITFQPDDTTVAATVLMPVSRISPTAAHPERGRFIMSVASKEDLGTIKLSFSNSYSMFSSKSLSFKSGLFIETQHQPASVVS